MSTSLPKPEILLIAGSWHTPAQYTKFRTILESKGLTVHIPRLPTISSVQPPTADLTTDTEFIRKYVTELADAGRYVIILMHSTGGQSGTNALKDLGTESRVQKGLPGGVTRLVYISALACVEGETGIDRIKKFGHVDFMPIAFDIAEDYTFISRDPKTLVVGPGLSDEELDAYVKGLERSNGKVMYQPLEYCAWRDIPVSYVYLTADMTVPFVYQKDMVFFLEEQGRSVQTFELETGHCPNITMPEELGEIIERIVDSDTA
ncbi:alpha/beta-hydrolase [Penicillium angulare]|uniref:Alpha/beta-hydrolase n=1 Tax=Penicillium angulare TaxID=116970 RepID=A0A9W9K707_9EURO|nr:alpha/beta-hydrolase [Penicillium angulare]